MVVAQALSYRYHDKTLALSDISFKLKQGEFTALLGANGAGKSTLLKTMVGLLHPYQGNLSLGGVRVTPSNLSSLYKKVGYVWQNSDNQLFMPTVYEDVAYGPNNLGLSSVEVERVVTSSLEEVRMIEMIKKPVYALSAGQKKRVALAGVLAMNPEILLLDEPVAGLDPHGVHHIMKLLKKLNKTRKLTIIMATHNVNILPVFMDRAIVMSDGRVLREGTPEEVFNGSLEAANLKLPDVAQLMKELKEKHTLPWQELPLTIAEAKEALSSVIQAEGYVTIKH